MCDRSPIRNIEAREKATKVRLLILDVDGVLTVDDIKPFADYVAEKRGGRGAVREVIEFILKSQGKWEEVTARYFR